MELAVVVRGPVTMMMIPPQKSVGTEHFDVGTGIEVIPILRMVMVVALGRLL
jgi:hypothetical protein